RTQPNTFSSESTRVERLRDFRNTRREGNKSSLPAWSNHAKIRPCLLYSVNRNFASSGKYAPATNRIAGGYHITDAPQLLSSRLFCPAVFSILILLTISVPPLRAQQPTETLELTRPVRSWEFLPVVGTRAGLFG